MHLSAASCTSWPKCEATVQHIDWAKDRHVGSTMVTMIVNMINMLAVSVDGENEDPMNILAMLQHWLETTFAFRKTTLLTIVIDLCSIESWLTSSIEISLFSSVVICQGENENEWNWNWLMESSHEFMFVSDGYALKFFFLMKWIKLIKQLSLRIGSSHAGVNMSNHTPQGHQRTFQHICNWLALLVSASLPESMGKCWIINDRTVHSSRFTAVGVHCERLHAYYVLWFCFLCEPPVFPFKRIIHCQLAGKHATVHRPEIDTPSQFWRTFSYCAFGIFAAFDLNGTHLVISMQIEKIGTTFTHPPTHHLTS